MNYFHIRLLHCFEQCLLASKTFQSEIPEHRGLDLSSHARILYHPIRVDLSNSYYAYDSLENLVLILFSEFSDLPYLSQEKLQNDSMEYSSSYNILHKFVVCKAHIYSRDEGTQISFSCIESKSFLFQHHLSMLLLMVGFPIQLW